MALPSLLSCRNAAEAEPRTKCWLDGANIFRAGQEAVLVSGSTRAKALYPPTPCGFAAANLLDGGAFQSNTTARAQLGFTDVLWTT